MPPDLEKARDRAHSVRFRMEGITNREPNLARAESAVRMNRKWGLEITDEVTPALYCVVMEVCGKFALPPSLVRTFVHPSATVQASCTSAEGKCIVEITSRLVEQLDKREQQFVIGHELGHFLLDHQYLPLPPDKSFERYQLLRAREISADRIGLIACGTPEAAIRATMKTFSGLGSDHLRFDAAAFLRNAFSDDKRLDVRSQPEDTHPSFYLRARCLVHFASILGFDGNTIRDEEFERIEGRIEHDFIKYGESAVGELIADMSEALAQWVWLQTFVADGRVTVSQLALLTDRFGDQFAQSAKNALSGMSKSEVRDLVERNLSACLQVLSDALPGSASRRLVEILDQCEKALGLRAGAHPLRKRALQ